MLILMITCDLLQFAFIFSMIQWLQYIYTTHQGFKQLDYWLSGILY